MNTDFSGFISTLYTVKEKISELPGKSIKITQSEIEREKSESRESIYELWDNIKQSNIHRILEGAESKQGQSMTWKINGWEFSKVSGKC